jgi:hypothetical protein
MTAMNVVHMRAKPGKEAELIAQHKDRREQIPGMRKGWLLKTGERSFCFVAEWDSFQSIVGGRAQMIESLDRMRDLLEDLGGGRGVTEPYSGDVVVEITP